MRVSREQLQQNRAKIVKSAGRLFRKHGFEAVTVSDVMSAAGLTHGGFYGYFDSKDDLIAQVLAEILNEKDSAITDLTTTITQYLSPKHRDNSATGCPVASLASDSMRQCAQVRDEMTAGLARQIDKLSQVTPGRGKRATRQAAVGSLATMVGALVLARASNDPELSNEILGEARTWLLSRQR